MSSDCLVPGSFRDPCGFLFWREGTLYRQVNTSFRDNYDVLMHSGLYERLVAAELLIPHQEVEIPPAEAAVAYKIIRPEVVPYISYPYEWCFGQFKDAALATLEIQKIALELGMSLRDASAYNIQFIAGKPCLIDTLSLEKYMEGLPWVGYRQFCQHFLAPLALMSQVDVRLQLLMREYIDGIPLDLAASLLPLKSRFSFSLLSHIHLHAKSQKRYANREVKPTQRKVGRTAMLGLIDNLAGAIRRLDWTPSGTEWGNYYNDTNYSNAAREHKAQLVQDFVREAAPATVWDLGGNVGVFSRIAAGTGANVVCFDIDPAAVEKNYREVKNEKQANLLPLLGDLTNPSPGIGWQHNERMSFVERGPADLVLALALVHHLAISNNVPLPKIAEFFAQIADWLIIEFVPKCDSQVQRLLRTREDIFDHYTKEDFADAFSSEFSLIHTMPIAKSQRTMYLMRKR